MVGAKSFECNSCRQAGGLRQFACLAYCVHHTHPGLVPDEVDGVCHDVGYCFLWFKLFQSASGIVQDGTMLAKAARPRIVSHAWLRPSVLEEAAILQSDTGLRFGEGSLSHFNPDGVPRSSSVYSSRPPSLCSNEGLV